MTALLYITNQRRHKTRKIVALFAILTLLANLVNSIRNRLNNPSEHQRVIATLTSWGIQNTNLKTSVSQKEKQRYINDLSSPNSEARVKAANWLAERGVRDASTYIATAMQDEQTRRPCQLAKSLGSLGDKQHADILVNATKQKDNVDLRVCATMALGELQSSDTINALIDVVRSGQASVSALRALGKIADPRSLDFLYSVAQNPRNEYEKAAALKAIEATKIMMAPDPVPLLLQKIEVAAKNRRVDGWAVRKLAMLQDYRAISALRNAYSYLDEKDTDGRIILTAGIIAHGDPGMLFRQNLEFVMK